jgi:hypothetical protein
MDSNSHHTAASSDEMQTDRVITADAPSTTGPATHADTVVIAVDGSKQSDLAFECKYNLCECIRNAIFHKVMVKQ